MALVRGWVQQFTGNSEGSRIVIGVTIRGAGRGYWPSPCRRGFLGEACCLEWGERSGRHRERTGQKSVSRRELKLPTREIAEICRRHRVRDLSVFGSVGTNRFRDDSDIDLLVEFEPGTRIGLIEFLQLQDELSALLGRPVDLVSKRGLKPIIRDAVLGDAEVLFVA